MRITSRNYTEDLQNRSSEAYRVLERDFKAKVGRPPPGPPVEKATLFSFYITEATTLPVLLFLVDGPGVSEHPRVP